jgi:surface polysaccharide O-acyltransferase-like enzyme
VKENASSVGHDERVSKPPTTGRMSGVDVARFAAALAVVFVHAASAQVGDAQPPSWIVTVREALRWTVPFFLATSCFFLMRALGGSRPVVATLRDRLRRLLPPLAVWSLIYVALKAVFAEISGDRTGLDFVLDDPTRLVVLGGAAVQLYYLPMLAVFVPVGWLVHRVVGRSVPRAAVVSVVGVALAWLFTTTDNNYDIATATALSGWVDPVGQPGIVRVLVVIVAWAVRLLPYLALSSLIINAELVPRCDRRVALAGLGVLVIMMIVARPVEDYALAELSAAFGLLLAGFGLGSLGSPKVQALISEAAELSFALFLGHIVVLQAVQELLGRLDLYDPAAISASSVIVAWALTSSIGLLVAIPIRRIKLGRQLLLGESS